jgi:hypothetical protein
MALILDGGSHRVSQLGPDFLILQNPTEHGPSEADLTLDIDGDQEHWRVFLPAGIQIAGRRVQLKRIS